VRHPIRGRGAVQGRGVAGTPKVYIYDIYMIYMYMCVDMCIYVCVCACVCVDLCMYV
jgi:hypothetical protein